jgi:hypothetical protein
VLETAVGRASDELGAGVVSGGEDSLGEGTGTDPVLPADNDSDEYPVVEVTGGKVSGELGVEMTGGEVGGPTEVVEFP